jgi:signal-transduction protein with cAMP-binding, CBS, and nucleotidyltransferase domain
MKTPDLESRVHTMAVHYRTAKAISASLRGWAEQFNHWADEIDQGRLPDLKPTAIVRSIAGTLTMLKQIRQAVYQEARWIKRRGGKSG